MYNAIYIIESFNDKNSSSYFLKYGESLQKSICRYIRTNQCDSFTCNLVSSLRSKRDFNSFFKDLETKSKQGEKPVLHFICHGEEGGLKIVDDIIPWKELALKFKMIHGCSGNLFVTMNVCFSSLLYKHISLDTFTGCICADGKIYIGNYRLVPRFGSFYEAILSRKSLQMAIDAAKSDFLQEIENLERNQWRVCVKSKTENNFLLIPLNKWCVDQE